MRAGFAVAVALVLASSCARREPEPAPLDTRNETCASCRMPVSDARLASQVVAPGELPRFFDDLGCLAGFVRGGRAPAGSVVFVADHRTRQWVRAERALYTRVPGLETPMSSHLVAHLDRLSRDQDQDASGGMPVEARELFGPAGPPSGAAR